MIRPVVRDVLFLRQKSEPATQGDLSIGQDLRDTLASNRDRCVGMAANMISGSEQHDPFRFIRAKAHPAYG